MEAITHIKKRQNGAVSEVGSHKKRKQVELGASMRDYWGRSWMTRAAGSKLEPPCSRQ